MKRDLPERLLFGREYDYVSTFISDRAFDHGAHTIEDMQTFAGALAQPGNTRGGLEWYRAFPTDHRHVLAWKQEQLTIPVLALRGEHNYGSRMVAIRERGAPGMEAACSGLNGSMDNRMTRVPRRIEKLQFGNLDLGYSARHRAAALFPGCFDLLIVWRACAAAFGSLPNLARLQSFP
jgi:hypothetical protein